jgi:tetratricopeptide (TPR) repeat protein
MLIRAMINRICVRGLLPGLVALVAASGPVSAQGADPARALGNCKGGAGIWSDLRLSACTDLIKSGKYSGGELARIHHYRGNARLMQSDYRGAIDDFNVSLKLGAGNAEALHGRCWAKAVLNKDLEEALADCNEALRLKPNDPEMQGGRGFLYLRLGFFKTSILDYSAAIEGMPNEARFHYGRGLAKSGLGDEDGADADFLTARALDPKIDAVFENFDDAAGGRGVWGTITGYWRAVMKWIY